jgi:hypothetical protein
VEKFTQKRILKFIFLCFIYRTASVVSDAVRFKLETVFLLLGAQKKIGHAGATPASVAPDAFRVQTLHTQVFRFLGPKKKPACAGLTCLVPRRGSVTQARPRHPLHRMPFESCREVRRYFAFWAKKKPACAGSILLLVPRRGLDSGVYIGFKRYCRKSVGVVLSDAFFFMLFSPHNNFLSLP